MKKSDKQIKTPKIELGMDLVKNLQDIILRRRSLIVCDENTVELIPKSLFNLKNLQFIRLYRPLASKALSIALIPHLKCKDLIIAFGTGTITDICKYAASITNKSYIVFPTAPSVNAYTSSNASLLDYKGKKKSQKAKMPEAVYLDATIFTTCPKRLILSGLYDLICSATVHPDFFLSHLVKDCFYSKEIFALAKAYEEELTKYLRHLLQKDIRLCTILMQCLINSGLQMAKFKSSSTASQSEHMIAHLSEARYRQKFLHGEYVASGMMIASKVQEKIFLQKSITINRTRFTEYIKVANCKGVKCNVKSLQTRILVKLEELQELTKEHDKIRNFISSSNFGLPRVNNITTKTVFLTRDRFTCLDLAFLANLDLTTI